MATQIIRPTNREEWLDVRKSGIGSSEVATIQVGGGRKYRGSEISPNYLEYANKRIAIAESVRKKHSRK